MTAMSQASYARRLGVTPAAITQWKKAGSIVMRGALVDVEQSDALLAHCRRDGLPAIRAGSHEVRRGRPVAEPVDLTQLRTEAASIVPVPMTRESVAQRLAALDWTLAFDWSEDAQRERARLAAACVGLEAIESALRDDGHWGEFQLRDPAGMSSTGLPTEDAVRLGFGFEAVAGAVIALCRSELEPATDGDGEPWGLDEAVSVNAVLLPLLAHPHYENEKC